MVEKLQADAPPSCPTFEALPEDQQKALSAAFDRAVSLAKEAGLPESEIFQFVEDVLDLQSIDEARAEAERTGEKPVPLSKMKKGLGL